ncbi:MAG: outer membrane protein assembly factor BamE [Bordetella sp.]|nr:MAG: outer membrane protein assembly factor BamE [Bordetella sp.]
MFKNFLSINLRKLIFLLRIFSKIFDFHKTFYFIKKITWILFITLSVSSCFFSKKLFSPCESVIYQGIWITDSDIKLLQPNMTKNEVLLLLGNPSLSSILDKNRWDYLYFQIIDHIIINKRQLTVWFKDDCLVRWLVN